MKSNGINNTYSLMLRSFVKGSQSFLGMNWEHRDLEL